MGQAFVETREYENAAAHFKTAVKIEPDFAFAYTNLGAIHLDKNEPSAALGMYEKALAGPGLRKMDLAKTHAGIGNACALLGRYDLAWKHTRRAQQLGFPVEIMQPMIDALRKVSPEPQN